MFFHTHTHTPSGSIDLHNRAGPCSVSLQAFQSASDLLRRFAWWCFGLAQLHVPLETRPVRGSIQSVFLALEHSNWTLEDLPHNVVVSSSGRGARGERHPLDVVVLVKRFAADQELCQEKPLLNHSIEFLWSCVLLLFFLPIFWISSIMVIYARRQCFASRTVTWIWWVAFRQTQGHFTLWFVRRN